MDGMDGRVGLENDDEHGNCWVFGTFIGYLRSEGERGGLGFWGWPLGKLCTRAWATPVLFPVFHFCFPIHVVHEDDREAFLLDGLIYMT